MNLEHTPAPWQWSVMDYSTAALHSNGRFEDTIMDVSPCRSCLDELKKEQNPIWKWGRCTTPSEANALLISAAPEMLDALIEVAECRLFWEDSMDRKDGLEYEVKKLIEKATGKPIDQILKES